VSRLDTCIAHENSDGVATWLSRLRRPKFNSEPAVVHMLSTVFDPVPPPWKLAVPSVFRVVTRSTPTKGFAPRP
jgi:hypothetical protein